MTNSGSITSNFAAAGTLAPHEQSPRLAGICEYAQDSEANQRVEEILLAIGKQVAGNLPWERSAILLTGSFARGEGSVIREGNRLKMLSDMEFMVVCPSGSDVDSIQQSVNQKAQELSGWLAAKAVECEIEFSAVDHNYLRHLRPAIFNYELLAHARTVWGDEQILAAAPRFPASAIPRWDAWRLLNNRMLEQLQWADLSSRRGAAELQAAFYHVLKCYLDMATAILIFAGHYRSHYGERAGALEAWAGTASKEGVTFAQELARRVSACTAFKLHPDFRTLPLGVDLSQEPERLCVDVRRTMVELVHVIHQVWRWAGNTFVGAPDKSREEDGLLQDAMMRSQPLREKLRGWAKLTLMPEARRQPRFFQRMRRLMFKGSPRYLTYAVASSLYFRLPEIMDGTTPKVEGQESLLPVTFAANANIEAGWWRWRADVLRGWRLFLRNHWA